MNESTVEVSAFPALLPLYSQRNYNIILLFNMYSGTSPYGHLTITVSPAQSQIVFYSAS